MGFGSPTENRLIIYYLMELNILLGLILCCFFVPSYSNLLQCPDRHFWNYETSTCEPCMDGCNTCTSSGCQQSHQQSYTSTDLSLRTGFRGFKSNARLLRDCDNDDNCNVCDPIHNNRCILCVDGYALDGSMRCRSCHNSCQTCDAPNNAGNCLTCLPGDYFQNATNHCRSCQNIFGSRCIQCTSVICTTCANGYYMDNSASGCVACPLNCQTCSVGGCQLCNQYYQLVNGTCNDICGDSYTITLPCDLAYGILYDGCSDTCQIQGDFDCNVINFMTDCFYLGTLAMGMDAMVRNPSSNTLQITVNLFPPLYAFQFTNLYEIFSINDTDFVIQNLQYINGKLNLKVQFMTTVIGRPFSIIFNPNISSDLHLVQSQQSVLQTTVVTQILAYHYSEKQFLLAKILFIVCILIVLLSWVIFFVAVSSRRLAGLELLFIVQFCWVCLLWLPHDIPTTYQQAIALKYSTGFNPALTKATFETDLPIQAQVFSIDIAQLYNNLNVSLILYALPLILAIVFKILSLNQKFNKQGMIRKYEFCQEMTMYGTLANLIGLITFAFVYFSEGQLPNPVSLIIFSFASLVTVGTLIKFYFDPDPFNRFRYEFKIQKVFVLHIYFHVVNIFLSLLLLFLVRTLYWACCIPPLALCIFTLIFRPYKQLLQNLRSAYFLLIMAMTGGLRALYCSQTGMQLHSEKNLSLLVIFLCVFFILAIIWSYISIILDCLSKKQVEDRKQQTTYKLFENMKFLQDIANTQKLLHLEVMKKRNEFGESNKFRDNQNGLNNGNGQLQSNRIMLAKNINKQLKNSKIQQNSDKSSVFKQYKVQDIQLQEVQYMNEQNKPKKTSTQRNVVDNDQKNIQDMSQKELQKKNQEYKERQKKFNEVCSDLQLQKLNLKIKKFEPLQPFKLKKATIIRDMFSYNGTIKIDDEMEQNLKEKVIIKAEKPQQKQQINFEEVSKNKILKQTLCNQIDFVKIKLAEKLSKSPEQQLMVSYNQIN